MVTFKTLTITLLSMCFGLQLMLTHHKVVGLSDNCTIKGHTCDDLMESFTRATTDSDTIESACEMFEQSEQCYGDCIEEIEATPIVGLGIRLKNYYCDPSNREQIETVRASYCFRRGSLEKLTMGGKDECLHHLLAAPGANSVIMELYGGNTRNAHVLCPGVNQMIQCVVNVITGKCGEVVRPVMSDMVKIVFRDLAASFLPPCVSQIS